MRSAFRRRIVGIMPRILSQAYVQFLTIVTAFVNKIGVVEEVNRLCAMESDLSPGFVVSAMILDTLSGRSPLCRFERFVSELDTELILGEEVTAKKFNEDALGRVLVSLCEVGTGRIFTTIIVRVVKLFDLDTSHVHHDTTGHTVYGDYELYDDPDGHPFVITYGFNKDHIPDLKQIVHSLLWVDHGIPVRSKLENWNKSDKTVNEDLLRQISEVMSRPGAKDFICVADCALVTQTNLELMSDTEKGCHFVTKLPESCSECIQAIDRAISADALMGRSRYSLPTSPNREKEARLYRGFETNVTLYGRSYRELVVHSDALDRRKTKKLSKVMEQDCAELTKIKAEQEKIRYAKGKPKADGTRKIAAIMYHLCIEVSRDKSAIAQSQHKTGCFVRLTNALSEGSDEISSRDLLFAYKDQGHVERNFGFLKDAVIVNSLFLKSPERIEALGLILVLSLLVWRLIERTMRLSLKEKGFTITGWDNRQTSRPITFMTTTYFPSLPAIRTPERGIRGKPLNPIQLNYLAILGLSLTIFVDPRAGFVPSESRLTIPGPLG
ncbi:MAG: IS1634 family transposase [Desulfomonilaceae bacterium]